MNKFNPQLFIISPIMNFDPRKYVNLCTFYWLLRVAFTKKTQCDPRDRHDPASPKQIYQKKQCDPRDQRNPVNRKQNLLKNTQRDQRDLVTQKKLPKNTMWSTWPAWPCVPETNLSKKRCDPRDQRDPVTRKQNLPTKNNATHVTSVTLWPGNKIYQKTIENAVPVAGNLSPQSNS